MNIIFIRQCTKKSNCLDLGRLQVLLPLFLLLVLVAGGLAYGGYRLGLAGAERDPSVLVTAWEQELDRQRSDLEATRRAADEQIAALSLKLGQMQAHVIRLDALGQRLTKMAQLDNGEFDFDNPPAQGGPANPAFLESVGVADLVQAMKELDAQLDDREDQLSVLENLLLSRNLQSEIFPTGRPVNSGWISSFFGSRTDPFTGGRDYHHGMDFAGKLGSDVVAVASGVVTFSGRRHGYGNLVEVNHGNGLVTRYGHNSENLVVAGDTVKKGQVLALMGSSGRSTGPHVHFEVLRNGRAVNPIKYIRAAR
jgi:murein DD-endopeptidase MepM/ murein hydrolase activator NlpD